VINETAGAVDAGNEAQGPRLCPTCQRPAPALDRSEYTDRRADLVIERGLCVCEEPAG
jgi:hypothetical protein